MEYRKKGPGTAAFVIVLIIAILAIAATVYLGIDKYKSIQKELEEKAKPEVTVVLVEQKLEKVAELSTYSYVYSGYEEIKDARQLFGWNVPLTTHEINITYNGIIKAGYDFDKIDIRVDGVMKKIHITFPRDMIVDNILNEEDVVVSSKNNVFNPIDADEVTKFLAEIKAETLKKAEEEGLYQMARENAERVIENFLSVFEEYEVVYH